MRSPKVLFILKKKKLYDDPAYAKTIQSGLYNSAHFVFAMLLKHGVDANCIQVNDHNDIDREVTKYRPNIVIIEALWVTPEKFKILHKLHPKVKWVVRIHSEIPFIANEGIAMQWIHEYSAIAKSSNLWIAPNTKKMTSDLRSLGIKHTITLPNYYPTGEYLSAPYKKAEELNIGCFGAIRPLKNQLIQAVAAIEYANQTGKKLIFHINSSRIERGETVIKNIRALFENHPTHKLVEHGWYNHAQFLLLIQQMDLGLQVSLSETFNIVAADFAACGIPVVGSKEISWLHWLYKADATSSESIVNRLLVADYGRKWGLQCLNHKKLVKASTSAKLTWLKYLDHK
jgi:hypothetical protein